MEYGAAASPEYFELWLADGSLIRRSPSFERSPETRRASLVKEPPPAPTPSFRDLRLPDGRGGRQIRLDFVPRLDVEDDPAGAGGASAAATAPSSRQTASVIVARERETLDATLRRLRGAVGGLAAALMLALAGLTQLALRVGLRSLDRLTQQVRGLDVTSLGARVAVAAPPQEIAVVVEQVNALLDRLEAGFTRERRLSSDIAHELKTPIAELRTLCEVGARWPEDRVAVRRFFEDARAIAGQMERIVVHLVALARYDEGREQAWRTRVRVAAVVEAAWAPLARVAAAEGQTLRQEISPALCFASHVSELEPVIQVFDGLAARTHPEKERASSIGRPVVTDDRVALQLDRGQGAVARMQNVVVDPLLLAGIEQVLPDQAVPAR